MMLATMAANPLILRDYDGMDPAALPEVLSVSSLFGVLDRISFQEDRFAGAGLFLRSYAGPAAIAVEFSTPMPIAPLDLPTIARLPRAVIVAAGKDPLARSSQLFYDQTAPDFPNMRFKLYPGAAYGFFCFGTGNEELGRDLLAFLAGQGPS